MRFLGSKKASQYIFFEMVPAFILGMLVFIFILLMFRALHLTEFVLIHGVKLEAVINLVTYSTISFLPALFPMALLFAVLMTYGRLSGNSEIIAFKAAGVSPWGLLIPAVTLSLIVAIMSAQTSFQLAPWGNRQFEVLINDIAQSKATTQIKEGMFSEGFFDLVVYANEVDTDNGSLKKVFIYDERDPKAPLTIIAKRGSLLNEQTANENIAVLRLSEGDVHKKSESHTKINFKEFDIRLSDPIRKEERSKSTQSLTLNELQNSINNTDLEKSQVRPLLSEWHRRWAVAVLCVLFGLIGAGLGTNTDRRSRKSMSLVSCLGVIVCYWIIYVSIEGWVRSSQVPVGPALWLPNLIFMIYSIISLRKLWI